VYSFTDTGASPSLTDTDLLLKGGRYERLERFEGMPGDILETFQYLFLGTNLSGTEVDYDS
jgi:hypothetical protein